MTMLMMCIFFKIFLGGCYLADEFESVRTVCSSTHLFSPCSEHESFYISHVSNFF